MLGGDGLVSRVAALTGRTDTVVATCDASPFMVEQAWARGIPAVRQRAESLLFRDASVGGVLLAYGSHHVPVAQRGTVAQEAFRVLQPGGVFVLHDFLTDSPVDVWFRKVVDVYAATGHDHPHFARDEAAGYLRSAGFEEVGTRLMDDSFVVTGATKEAAQEELGRYMADMYGLAKLDVPGRGRRRVDGDDAEGGTRGLRTQAGGAGLTRGPRLPTLSSRRRRRTAARGRGVGRRPASPGRG
ncbi:class I SAM-dependent methyltransferase [Streptomyces chrestomyceticus]|uniref:class I SAM-dependent methyltransferase n=1 Tax=Streptomyces chrestomyceticus TaxID=68185 RepID=UPI0036AAB649